MPGKNKKQVIHYCAVCNRAMSYEEKKMLYMYDVVKETNRGGFDVVRPKKRLAINLCEKCLEEAEELVNGLIKSRKQAH